MASPARKARLAAIANGFSEVHARGRNSLTMRNPTTDKFSLDNFIGDVHYGASFDQEIDTAWQVDTGAWQYRMTLAPYNAYARDILNVGDLIQYTDPATGQSVTFQPLGLNWVDNVTDSRQQIALPQAITATVNDDKLTWTNGYGTGRHFEWQAQTGMLQKVIKLDNASTLPVPTVNNPYIEIEFITKYSSDVLVFIDGVEWNKRDKINTGTNIEFRNATGQTLWYFKAPRAWDSSPIRKESKGIIQVRRQGAILYSTVRFPKLFIDSATFPIYLDDTVSYTVSVSANDAYEDATITDIASSDLLMWRSGDWVGLRFLSVALAGSYTIDVAHLHVTVTDAVAIRCTITGDNADSAAIFADIANNISGRTDTSASASWSANPSNYTEVESPSIKTIVEEIIARGGWNSGQNMALLMQWTTGGNSGFFSWDGSSSDAAHLHVEYTEGGGCNTVVIMEVNTVVTTNTVVQVN